MNLKLDELLGVCGNSSVLSVFDGRYSDGLIVTLLDDYASAAAIEDNFNGGDIDWMTIRNLLINTPWFPMVICKKIDEVVPAMHTKLQTISELYPKENVIDWQLAVTLMADVIKRDRHTLLKAEELTDIIESRRILESLLHENDL